MKCKHKWATAIHHVTYKWCGYVCESCGKCSSNLGFVRFWNWLLHRDDRRVVRIKSLIPSWDEHHNAPAWPTLLVDTNVNQRVTVTPIWNRVQFRLAMSNRSKGGES